MPDSSAGAWPSPLDELSQAEREALHWSVRLAGRELGPEDRAAFSAWLDASPEHAEHLAAFDAVSATVERMPLRQVAHLQAVVAIDGVIRNANQASGSAPRPERLPLVAGSEVPAATAASPIGSVAPPGDRLRRMVFGCLLAVAIGAGWSAWQYQRGLAQFSQSFSTHSGQQRDVTLPEGSRLGLDTATAAEVRFYRDRREVQLREGRVLFEVQKDAGRPFIVHAGNARIQVVGTRFSVRYTPSLGERAVQVGVIEGQVRVSGPDAAGQTLIARQALIVDADGRLQAAEATTDRAVVAWRSGRLDFNDVPLSRVIAELRRYGVDSISVSEEAGRFPITVSVELTQLQGFVTSLPGVLPVKVDWQAGHARISARH